MGCIIEDRLEEDVDGGNVCMSKVKAANKISVE